MDSAGIGIATRLSSINARPSVRVLRRNRFPANVKESPATALYRHLPPDGIDLYQKRDRPFLWHSDSLGSDGSSRSALSAPQRHQYRNTCSHSDAAVERPPESVRSCTPIPCRNQTQPTITKIRPTTRKVRFTFSPLAYARIQPGESQASITRTFLCDALLLSGWRHVMLSWLSLRVGGSSSSKALRSHRNACDSRRWAQPNDEAYCA
jgi:hypothetical protein